MEKTNGILKTNKEKILAAAEKDDWNGVYVSAGAFCWQSFAFGLIGGATLALIYFLTH